MKKAVLIICDGMGDLPIKGKTPLQSANKPNMDILAAHGINGLLHPISPGIIPGSDTAHLALLGYDPSIYYGVNGCGRGVFEALGVGLNLREGDIAFRCNFASVNKKMDVIDRRAGRIQEEGKELSKLFDETEINGVKIIFKHSVEHRGVLVLRGEGLSPAVSDTDPHSLSSVLKCKALNTTKEANKTAEIINKFTEISHKLLKEHPINKERVKEGKQPANIILVRGAGVLNKVESLKEKYHFNSACIAGASLYKGVARYVGMNVINIPGATGTISTDLGAKAKGVREALKSHEFVFLHIKGTDNASHDGNLEAKISMIERVDKLIGSLMNEDAYIILTSDHSTPVSKRRHSSEPVPIVIYGEEIRVDDVVRFDELSASKGGLGHIKGLELLPIIVDLMGYGKMYGS